jgi:hypothetical protein
MSKSSSSNSTSGGISLCGAIFLVFLFLKLAGIGQVTNWSWWWVTSPLWIPLLIGIAIIICIGVYYGIKYLIKQYQIKKFRKKLDKEKNGL